MAVSAVVCFQSSKDTTSQPAAAATAAAADDDDDDDRDDDDEGVKNMYVFEGKDYSKEPSAADRDAFQQLVDGIYLLSYCCYYAGKLIHIKSASVTEQTKLLLT